jgi:hypothetical protein
MRLRTAAALVSVLLCPVTAMAGPIGIEVFNAQYTADFSTKIRSVIFQLEGPDIFSTATAIKTSTVAQPLAEHFQSSTRVDGTAIADMFSVFAETEAFFDLALNETSAFADATARTVLTFSPTESGLATLGLDIVTRNQNYFTDGLVSLLDMTTNQRLLDYQWAFGGIGNVPFTCCSDANITFDQAFLSAHQYVLTMQTHTNANTDSQWSSIRVSGLTPVSVPEPSSLVLLTTGLIGFLAKRRRGEPASTVRSVTR